MVVKGPQNFCGSGRSSHELCTDRVDGAVVRVRQAASVLVVLFLLVGCTAPSPAAQGTMSPTTTIDTTRSSSATPLAEVVPSPSPTDWLEFVTIGADEYGLAPDGWSTYGPVITWAERYCELEGLSPCEGLADRAAPLCIERRDCHPAVLVPFEEGTAAFVAGGVFPEPRVIAVWRPATDPELAPFGGARKILEEYLLSVDVYPSTSRLVPDK